MRSLRWSSEAGGRAQLGFLTASLPPVVQPDVACWRGASLESVDYVADAPSVACMSGGEPRPMTAREREDCDALLRRMWGMPGVSGA